MDKTPVKITMVDKMMASLGQDLFLFACHLNQGVKSFLGYLYLGVVK